MKVPSGTRWRTETVKGEAEATVEGGWRGGVRGILFILHGEGRCFHHLDSKRIKSQVGA